MHLQVTISWSYFPVFFMQIYSIILAFYPCLYFSLHLFQVMRWSSSDITSIIVYLYVIWSDGLHQLEWMLCIARFQATPELILTEIDSIGVLNSSALFGVIRLYCTPVEFKAYQSRYQADIKQWSLDDNTIISGSTLLNTLRKNSYNKSMYCKHNY